MSTQHFQHLEDRRLMSATLDAVGVLKIDGTSGNDTIEVTQNTYSMSVKDNGVTTTYGLGDVKSISIDAMAGHDSVTLLRVTRPATISGGSGSDTLAGGRGNDYISGNGGDDVIRGGGGSDYIYGHSSGFTAGIYERPRDIITRNLYVTNGLFQAAPQRAYISNNLVGKVVTKPAFDLKDIIAKPIDRGIVPKPTIPPIFFLETDWDQIFGGAGNDTIVGGDGNDTLHGEAGADYVYGGADKDQVFGNEDGDRLYGEAGADLLEGGAGADYVYGGADKDQIFGNEDGDRLYGEAGADSLEGGAGADYVDGGTQIDKVLSNDGDTIKVGSCLVYGAIGIKYVALGGEGGFLGAPYNSETGTPDGVGRYNHFAGGSIYWTESTGAHVVYGAIRDMWENIGWERSALGYPTSDELQDGGERVSHFQNGTIAWNENNGAYIRRIKMPVPMDQLQNDSWSCGPNSVSRVLRYYGIDVSYGTAKNSQKKDTDLVSRFKMGSRPSALLATFRKWKADAQRESRTSFDRVLQVLSEGKPVVALIGKDPDYTIGLGTVPGTLHWIALTGFDKKTGQIFYTDTRVDEKTKTNDKQYTYAQFNQVWNWYSSGAKGGFLTGTLDVPERTILH